MIVTMIIIVYIHKNATIGILVMLARPESFLIFLRCTEVISVMILTGKASCLLLKCGSIAPKAHLVKIVELAKVRALPMLIAGVVTIKI